MSTTHRLMRLTPSWSKALRSGPSSASGTLRLVGARYSSSTAQDPMTGELAQLPDIEPSLLEVTRTQQPKQPPPPSSLVFGRTFTDHMLTVPWSILEGWGKPRIQPYGPLSVEPSATVLHYAHCLFEGLKAYRDPKGRVTLFRPDMNMKRMNTSAERIAMPTFNGAAMLELIKELIRLDKHWIPDEPGYSLYIRPTMIGTQPALGIAPPKEVLFFVILSPVGPYYPHGFKPVALYGTTEYTRASPGGIGAYKLGANYAAGVAAQKAAAQKGYMQNLWLHGPEHYITEVGTMNAFAVFKRSDGSVELVTPPLDGIILPGVTRDSVLALAREHQAGKILVPELTDKLVVSERPMTMKEVKEAVKNGTLVEFFGTGTAAVVSPVDRIGYLGEDLHISTGPDGMGPITRPLWKYLTGIQTGAISHPWSVEV
ncbi:branched-chain amino acid aminotransferase II [Trametes punicea]|nr:branched-chain amino acid aminotransferase II [Trametes punicea]